MSYVAKSVKYVTLVLASIVTILPIIVIVMASFKTHKEFYASSPLSPPVSYTHLTLPTNREV